MKSYEAIMNDIRHRTYAASAFSSYGNHGRAGVYPCPVKRWHSTLDAIILMKRYCSGAACASRDDLF